MSQYLYLCYPGTSTAAGFVGKTALAELGRADQRVRGKQRRDASASYSTRGRRAKERRDPSGMR